MCVTNTMSYSTMLTNNQGWRQEFPDRGADVPDGGGAKLECPLKYQIFKNDL